MIWYFIAAENGLPVAKSAAPAPSDVPGKLRSELTYQIFCIICFHSFKVGPGASKDGAYKNPEYYTYNPMSFYDIEKDMKPFRIPQPSSKK